MADVIFIHLLKWWTDNLDSRKVNLNLIKSDLIVELNREVRRKSFQNKLNQHFFATDVNVFIEKCTCIIYSLTLCPEKLVLLPDDADYFVRSDFYFESNPWGKDQLIQIQV